jgi:galactokinase
VSGVGGIPGLQAGEDVNEIGRAAIGELGDKFREISGGTPEGIWRCPGRVNLIGEHTDYNDGLALPFAIDRTTFVAARRRPGSVVRVWSANLESQASADLGDLEHWEPSQFSSWARLPFGVIWAMNRRGARIRATDIYISSTVPLGSGLSSSAALTVGVAVALDGLAGTGLVTSELARISQQAESSFGGVPLGLLDQLAVLEGRAGQGVLVDFSTMQAQLVPLGTGPFVVMNTCVERANASGAYANRRATCEEAAKKMGLRSLRQADLAQVESQLEGDLLKRARHVVTENARVRETASRLRNHGPIGDLLVGSHLSLREDYEVSCPELDAAVETALANGASGARLTGAGLGGCAISLGATVEQLAEPLAEAFAAAGFKPPEVFGVTPSDGAGRVE